MLSSNNSLILKPPEQNLISPGYEKIFADMQSIQGIADEFKDCTITTTIRGGKPVYITAETHTQNIDFNLWQKKLGEYRTIEENVSDNHTTSLKILKKFRYDN